jgi:SpoVK/Ycf46/Vps4 family AAA+-type ATPase
MDRIIIDLSKGELDFVREALVTKHNNLMGYLDTCEGEFEKPDTAWEDIVELAEGEFDKELAKFSTPKKKPFVYKKKAPYGVKKDGTPKAKPGRKA